MVRITYLNIVLALISGCLFLTTTTTTVEAGSSSPKGTRFKKIKVKENKGGHKINRNGKGAPPLRNRSRSKERGRKAEADENAAGGGGGGDTGTTNSRRRNQNAVPSSASVVIIGAGWSGISAAKALINQGITSVILLEAKWYVGGRSHTLDGYFSPGLPTELGCEWTYPDSPAKDLVDQYNIQYTPTGWGYDDFNFYKASTSSIVSESEKYDRIEEVWTGNNGFINYAGGLAKNKGSSSVTNYGQAMENYQSIYSSTLSENDKKWLNALVQPELVTEMAAPLDTISIPETAYLLGPKDDELSLAVPGGGFGTMLKNEYASFEDKIYLNKEVTKIQSSSSFLGGASTITYLDRNTGEVGTVTADTVLVTVSLGVLKSGSIDFQPNLPTSKQNAIAVAGYGTLNKCIMYWADETQALTWWPTEKTWLQLITDDDASSGVWTTFFNSWDRSRSGSKPILSAWIGGDDAVAYESKTDAETLDLIMINLRKMFGSTLPAPTSYIVTRWNDDPFSQGSYSFPRAGTDFYGTTEALRERTGNIFWSGEALDDEWWATTVGAMQTGERAASDIASYLGDRSDFPLQVLENVCFSPYAKTNVLGKGRIPMKNLMVGDKVLTANGKYETIFTLNHFHRSKKTKYLQIHVTGLEGLEQPIELTHNHMLFTKENDDPVPASQIKVGDSILSAWEGPKKVTRIEIVTRNGLYNPLTSGGDGTIVVDGIVASTYTSYTGKAHIEMESGRKLISFHTIMDITCAPYRALYSILPPKYKAHESSFSDDGEDSGPMMMLRNSMREFFHIWSEQNMWIQYALFFVYVSMFGVLSIFLKYFWINSIVILIVHNGMKWSSGTPRKMPWKKRNEM